MTDERTRWVVGCMTGTSLDGLDVVLADVRGRGLDITVRYAGMATRPLGPQAQVLRAMAEGEAHAAKAYAWAARQLGELHAEAVAELCKRHLPRDVDRPDLVVAHGQTICHAPRDEAGPISWQLFDPWPIAHRLGVRVCWDLRQADLAAGGEGAPITPLADWVLYRSRADLVVNLGGIANVTRLGQRVEQIEGWDVGPCNILLDGLCRMLFDESFDRDGRIAARGKAHANVVATLAALLPTADAGRSLDRAQFDVAGVLARLSEAHPEVADADILRAAVRFVATSILEACKSDEAGERRMVLAGGGARNGTLVEGLRELAAQADLGAVRLSDELGIPCEAREAMCFAVLGALSEDGVPITLEQVTGATNPGVAGAWAHPSASTRSTCD